MRTRPVGCQRSFQILEPRALLAAAALSDPGSGVSRPDLLGDINEDWVVDSGDYQQWRDNFGVFFAGSTDLNGDRVTDAADYTIWRDNVSRGWRKVENEADDWRGLGAPTEIEGVPESQLPPSGTVSEIGRGATATLSFRGTRIVLLGTESPFSSGVVDIRLDGNLLAEGVRWDMLTAHRQVIWTSPTLAEGDHELSLTVVDGLGVSVDYALVYDGVGEPDAGTTPMPIDRVLPRPYQQADVAAQGPSLNLAAGDYVTTFDFTIDEVTEQRRFIVHVPPNATENMPVVFNIHGVDGTAEGQQVFTGFDELADREGIIVVYPEAPSNWLRDGEQDYVIEVLDRVIEAYKPDVSRIYATGFSAGGFVANSLGMLFPDRFAAIGSVAGGVPPEFYSYPTTTPESMPAIFIHNQLDDTVPFAGIPEALRFWRQWHGGATSPVTATLGPNELTRTVTSSRGVETVLYDYRLEQFDEDLGVFTQRHDWPRLSGGEGFEANEILWDFFKRYARAPDAGTTAPGAQEATASAVAVVGGVTAAAAQEGVTLYVDAAARPGGDGDAQTPFSSITAALQAASEGDTVRIRSGTYRELVDVTQRGLSLVGEGSVVLTSPDREVSEEEGNVLIDIKADDVTVSGLSLHDNLFGAAVRVTTTGADLSEVDIRRNAIGVVLDGATSVTIDDSRFDMNTRDVTLSGVDGLLIEDSVFTNDGTFSVDESVGLRRTSAITSFFTGTAANSNLTFRNLDISGYSYYAIDIRTRDANGIVWTNNVSLTNSRIYNNGNAYEPDDDGNPEYNFGGVLWQGVEGGVVADNVIEGNVGWGMDAYRSNNVLYLNNLFLNNRPSPGQVGPGDGLEVNGGEGNRVYHNVFYGNEVGLFSSFLLAEGDEAPASVEIVNNVITGNLGGDDDGNYQAWGGGDDAPWAFDRVIRDNVFGPFSSGVSDPAEVVGPDNLFNVDPGFVDPANGDFRLRSDSPLIDAGSTASDTRLDFDGQLRPTGAAPDIGAFEFQSRAPLKGDFNYDGVVDAADYTVWRDASNVIDAFPVADADGDWDVDLDDLAAWKANFGARAADANTTPESAGAAAAIDLVLSSIDPPSLTSVPQASGRPTDPVSVRAAPPRVWLPSIEDEDPELVADAGLLRPQQGVSSELHVKLLDDGVAPGLGIGNSIRSIDI